MAQKEEKKSKALGGGLGGLIGGGLGAAGMLAALRKPAFRSGFMGNSGIPPGLTDVLGASVGGVFGGSLGAGLGSMEYSPKEGEEYSMDNMFSPTLSSLGGYGGALGGMAGGTRVAKNFLPTKNGLLKALLASAGGTIGGAALGGYGGGALGESLFAKD